MNRKDRVFLTGASGYIGGSILSTLVAQDHYDITVVVRSADSIPMTIQHKTKVIVGSIYDLDFARKAVKGHNVVIHCTRISGTLEPDLSLIRVLGEEARFATRNAQGVFINTSGIYTAGSGVETEKEEINEDMTGPVIESWSRKMLEEAVLSYSTLNLSTAIIRPAWVYGGVLGHRSHLQPYLDYCLSRSAIVYRGDLQTMMSAVHADDMVGLYLIILQNRLKGIFHACEKPITLNYLLEMLSAEYKLPLKEITGEDSEEAEGFAKLRFAHAMERIMSSNPGTLYARKTGWQPMHVLSQSLGQLLKR
jgi:nucleoside-diphosphate-sugar epimerase